MLDYLNSIQVPFEDINSSVVRLAVRAINDQHEIESLSCELRFLNNNWLSTASYVDIIGVLSRARHILAVTVALIK